MNPLISIIIPTFNRAHLLGETLDSLLAQSYQNWECIIVDDGSTDYTVELSSFYQELDPRFSFHHRPKSLPKGANPCRNYGFSLSRGFYINWFDDDDVMLRNCLELKTLNMPKDVQFNICSGIFVNQYLQGKEKMILQKQQPLFKSFVTWQSNIITNSVLFRKDFLQGKDLFSHKITRGEETEFFSRLFYNVSPDRYKFIDSPLFLYRQHSESKTIKEKDYVKAYEESRSYISIQNFKRSIRIKDKELVNYYYKALISMFFRGLEHNHLKNSLYVFLKLIPILKEIGRRRQLKTAVLMSISLTLKRSSYTLEKSLRSKSIKI